MTLEHMAEGTQGAGPEGAASNQVIANQQAYSGVETQAAAQSLEDTSTADKPLTPKRTPLEEKILKIPSSARMKFVMALPLDEQIEGLKVLKLNLEGGALAPDWLEKLAEEKSVFQESWDVVKKCLAIPPDKVAALSPSHKAEFDKLKDEGIKVMNETLLPKDNAEKEELQRILYFVRDDIRSVYIEATKSAPKVESESWYGAPAVKSLEERLDIVDKALSNYQERFWNYGEATLKRIFGETADIASLRQKYEGVAGYIAARAAVAIGKELKGLPLQPDDGDGSKSEYGDFYISDIRKELKDTEGERERKRREQRKRATADERLHYSDWRERFDFSWAETAEELDDSVEDWLDYFQQALPKEAEEAVYAEVQKGMGNALAALEKARNRISLEANNEKVFALREKIVGHVTTIAGARLLESKNGFEHYIKLRLDFAANYNGHYDGIYLKKGFGIMADKLSEDDGAIYRGGPADFKKPLSGDTRTYRGDLEREAIRYGSNHELYLTDDDFESAELGEREVRKAVSRLNLSFAEGQKRIQEILAERRKQGEKLGRHGWDDGIEELLLYDSRGLAKAQVETDPVKRAEAIERVRKRTGVFRKIKEALDKEDMHEDVPGHFVSLASLTPDERKNVIRQRIWAKITQEGYTKTLDDIRKMTDQESVDRALWKWVRDYNSPRLKFRKEGSNDEPWFPSRWDMERLSVTRPEDITDRVLSKDEFKAMVEKVDDPYKGLDDEQIKKQITDQFRRQTRKEALIAISKLSAQEKQERSLKIEQYLTEQLGRQPTSAEISGGLEQDQLNRLMIEKKEILESKIEGVLFERQQRKNRAERNFNLNVAQDKFIELQARYGGLTTRKVNEQGEVVMVTIYSEVEKILKAKIDKEQADVEEKVRQWKLGFRDTHLGLTPQQQNEAMDKQKNYLTKKFPKKTAAEIQQRIDEWWLGFEATHRGLTNEQHEQATVKQQRLFRRNCTFAATLGLRELGLANDLPIWNYSYYGDVSQIGAFAPLVGLTDDEKGELCEILDRGRREMEAVFSFVASQHMDGRILNVKDEEGLLIEDEDGMVSEAHEESQVRPRVINEGGVLKLRDLFEARFMISTSGGVKVADLIARIADLGVYDELWENGCKDKREWQGFRKRRNKWELREQSFLNTREWTDPITHVQRIAGSAGARKFLVGGEVQGQGYIPGVLNEPFNGLWRMRDEFLQFSEWISQNLKQVTSGSHELPELKSKKDLEKFLTGKIDLDSLDIKTPEQVKKYKAGILKILSYRDVGDYLTIIHRDKMVPTGAEILKFLTSFMEARRYVTNRAGYAPKNWQYDNELMLRAFFNVTTETKPLIAKKGDFKGLDEAGQPIYYEVDTKLADTGGEMVGGGHLAYASEGRTIVAVDIFRAILSGSSYHTLDAVDARTLDGKAWRTKKAMEAKRAEIVARGDPPALQQTVANYEAKLRSARTDHDTIAKEVQRLKNQYYDEQLHKEFVGEWSARLVTA